MTDIRRAPIPTTIDETMAMLTAPDYVADRSLATVLFLALRMKRPLFLEGEAGVGKTEIAKVLASRARPAADPAAVLRGPRRLLGGLRVELRRADDRDPHGGGRRRRRPRRDGAQRLLRKNT